MHPSHLIFFHRVRQKTEIRECSVEIPPTRPIHFQSSRSPHPLIVNELAREMSDAYPLISFLFTASVVHQPSREVIPLSDPILSEEKD